MKKILIIAALTITLTSLTFGQNAGSKPADASGAEQIVLKLTHDWIDAETKRDVATYDRIVADDFRGTAFNGISVTKKMIMPNPNAKPEGNASFNGSDFNARVFGDSAVVTGRSTISGDKPGEFFFTLVYVKRQDRWQMVAAHLSPIQPKG